MPEITAEFPKTDPALTAALSKFLASKGFGADGSPARFTVETMDDCTAAGAAIAEFIAANPGTYDLFLDGPEASSTLHQLHKAENRDTIWGNIALDAGLL